MKRVRAGRKRVKPKNNEQETNDKKTKSRPTKQADSSANKVEYAKLSLRSQALAELGDAALVDEDESSTQVD